jgi:hypothetical protein
MMEALSSSETSVLTRPTRRNIPEDGILEVDISSRDISGWKAEALPGHILEVIG